MDNLKPIKYLCSGRLGDFLNSLSVINEKYYDTGRKGILYMADYHGGDTFKFTLENCYKDIYNVIIKQKYICEFKIYNGEEYDINLNNWRDLIRIPIENFTSSHNWKNIYSNYFNVDWGKHRWLNNISCYTSWNDKILINMTTYRIISNSDKLKSIINENKKNVYFVTFEKEEYDFFINKYNLSEEDVNMHLIKSFEEMCIIINSCKYGYFGISSLAVIANALHKEHSIFCSQEEFGNYMNNLVNILPHVKELL